jgi:energy-coupling factor transporter ATP-binding protein EcfA2
MRDRHPAEEDPVQLIGIEFYGYKRLDGTKCNVAGRTIAFIGPNEAGKSSVLQALAWLTDPDAGALSFREQNRTRRPASDDVVVRARYRLDDSDIKVLQQLPIDPDVQLNLKTVRGYRESRQTDGLRRNGLDTTTAIGRNREPFNEADRLIHEAQLARERVDELPFTVEEVDPVTEALNTAAAAVDPADLTWTTDRVDRLRAATVTIDELIGRLQNLENEPDAISLLRKSLEQSRTALEVAAQKGELEDPDAAIRAALDPRAPQFVLFTDADRDLAETYDLADEAVRSSTPAPLRNLLRVAGTSAEELWTSSVAGDPTAMRTLELRANATLSQRLHPAWTQSKLTISLTLNQNGLLEVNILELDTPTITTISERSDGLRTFLGLVCFLIAADLSVPPVLMIDEAERNLHYDAQADLIRVLTRELKVHKVLYTTHSPGCLPLDLGTGIRVVARSVDDPGTSTLSNTFWTDTDPGFSRLLFAMGAEAAAFSAFRHAVLTEGVSEMILLPTLLRNATTGDPLNFQVAFGLSNMTIPQAIGSVAVKTTFLVDGDDSGDKKIDQLKKAGVPTSHLFQLPPDQAIEDLVDRATYLEVVNDFLDETDGGGPIPDTALTAGVTVATAVDDYAKANLGKPKGISHKIIASRLAELGDDLKINPSSRTYLKTLRTDLEDAFKNDYTLSATTNS